VRLPLAFPYTRVSHRMLDNSTSSLLKSLMNLVINRGLLVTAAQIILLITFFASSGHLYWSVSFSIPPSSCLLPFHVCQLTRPHRLAVHINTTKLYVNTFCQYPFCALIRLSLIVRHHSRYAERPHGAPRQIRYGPHVHEHGFLRLLAPPLRRRQHGSALTHRQKGAFLSSIHSVCHSSARSQILMLPQAGTLSSDYALGAIRVTTTSMVSDI
jgi:hypothetical protein